MFEIEKSITDPDDRVERFNLRKDIFSKFKSNVAASGKSKGRFRCKLGKHEGKDGKEFTCKAEYDSLLQHLASCEYAELSVEYQDACALYQQQLETIVARRTAKNRLCTGHIGV